MDCRSVPRPALDGPLLPPSPIRFPAGRGGPCRGNGPGCTLPGSRHEDADPVIGEAAVRRADAPAHHVPAARRERKARGRGGAVLHLAGIEEIAVVVEVEAVAVARTAARIAEREGDRRSPRYRTADGNGGAGTAAWPAQRGDAGQGGSRSGAATRGSEAAAGLTVEDHGIDLLPGAGIVVRVDVDLDCVDQVIAGRKR